MKAHKTENRKHSYPSFARYHTTHTSRRRGVPRSTSTPIPIGIELCEPVVESEFPNKYNAFGRLALWTVLITVRLTGCSPPIFKDTPMSFAPCVARTLFHFGAGLIAVIVIADFCWALRFATKSSNKTQSGESPEENAHGRCR